MDRAENEDAAVEHVVEILTAQFPDVPEDVVQETVDDLHASFEGAPVRDYIPVIIEHDAKEQLRSV